jgi:hypothetical protein
LFAALDPTLGAVDPKARSVVILLDVGIEKTWTATTPARSADVAKGGENSSTAWAAASRWS